jgi:hypothetical protein
MNTFRVPKSPISLFRVDAVSPGNQIRLALHSSPVVRSGPSVAYSKEPGFDQAGSTIVGDALSLNAAGVLDDVKYVGV